MFVYELTHIHANTGNGDTYDQKGLGLYTNYSSVCEAIDFFKTLPGFRDYPEGFILRRREVFGVYAGVAYEAIVCFYTEDYEVEYSLELGLFGREQDAQKAIDVFCSENASLFREGLGKAETILNCCVLNRREWSDGYDYDFEKN